MSDRGPRCGPCGRLVDGEVEGIRPTICCRKCCLRFARHGAADGFGDAGIHRVSKSYAERIGVRRSELCEIDSLVYGHVCLKLEFYLGAEAEWIGCRKRHLSVDGLRGRDKLVLRKVREGCLDDTCDMATAFAVSYYLRRPLCARVDAVERRWSVIDRVREICRECPRAHPDAAFEFCIERPEGGPVEFAALKRLTQDVFRLEGPRIMRFLTRTERRALVETPLEVDRDAYENRDKTGIVRKFLLERTSGRRSAEILAHPSCQERIGRSVDDFRTARQLLNFWNARLDVDERQRRLEDAFSRKGEDAHEHPAARFCAWCVASDSDWDALEAVGVHKVLSGTFGKRNRLRVERMPIALTKFEELYAVGREGLEDCVRSAVRFSCRVHVPIVESQSSWDRERLTDGYWPKKLGAFPWESVYDPSRQ